MFGAPEREGTVDRRVSRTSRLPSSVCSTSSTCGQPARQTSLHMLTHASEAKKRRKAAVTSAEGMCWCRSFTDFMFVLLFISLLVSQGLLGTGLKLCLYFSIKNPRISIRIRSNRRNLGFCFRDADPLSSGIHLISSQRISPRQVLDSLLRQICVFS